MKLGFSIYPENHPLKTSLDYIDLLVSYGAKRLFLSLLQIEVDGDDIFQKYKEVVSYARNKGLMVVADISPDFISSNNWSDNLIEKAHAFGLNGIRLDESLEINEIVILTHNSYGIKIELNSSTEKDLLCEILEKGGNRENLMGCHNFYPHRYTGLGRQHFLKMSQFYKDMKVESSVFISSQNATEGPWPVREGLPTLEELRELPIGLQADVYKATELFDNVIISNQFVSEEELKELSDILTCTSLTIKYYPEEISEIESQILSVNHKYRGDVSDYVIRSTESRVKFATESIPPRKHQILEATRGLITIDNDAYGRYKGELQIVLKSYPLHPKVNIVGQVATEYLLLLEFLKPWQSFRLQPRS